MKKTIPLLAAVTMLCGCSNLSKVLKAAGKDNSSIYIRVSAGASVIEYARANPSTNSLPHLINRDGTITVSRP